MIGGILTFFIQWLALSQWSGQRPSQEHFAIRDPFAYTPLPPQHSSLTYPHRTHWDLLSDLHGLPEESLEAFLPQICNMVLDRTVLRDSLLFEYFERILLQKCAYSISFGMRVSNTLQVPPLPAPLHLPVSLTPLCQSLAAGPRESLLRTMLTNNQRREEDLRRFSDKVAMVTTHGHGLPAAESRMRAEYVQDMQYLMDALTRLGLILRSYPGYERPSHLRKALGEINQLLADRMLTGRSFATSAAASALSPPSTSLAEALTNHPYLSSRSLHMPLLHSNDAICRLLGFCDCEVLQSKDRVPYLVTVEMIREPHHVAKSPALYMGSEEVSSSIENKLSEEEEDQEVAGGEGISESVRLFTQMTPQEAQAQAVFGRPRPWSRIRSRHHRPTDAMDLRGGGGQAEDEEAYPTYPEHLDEQQQAPDPYPAHPADPLQDYGYDSPSAFQGSGYPPDHYHMRQQQQHWQQQPQQHMQQSVSGGMGPRYPDTRYPDPRSRYPESPPPAPPSPPAPRSPRPPSPYAHLPGYTVGQFIVKGGDSLIKELLVIQVIALLQDLFAKERLPVYLQGYEIYPLGNGGLIEYLQGISIDALKAGKMPGMSAEHTLTAHFREVYGEAYGVRHQQAMKRFIGSLVGYSLLTYVMQVKDRHNANILLTPSGALVHLDFGYLLGESPRSINFENAPFKFTREYLHLLGGVDSAAMREFEDLFVKGFVCLQRNIEGLLAIIQLHYGDKGKQAVEGVKARLLFARNHDDILSLITDSVDNWRTRQYDWYQEVTNGIHS